MFVGDDGGEGCRFKFNGATITWRKDYRMDRKQRLSALAYELRKANLTVRLVRADMQERNILCNKMSHQSKFGCDQCVCQTTSGYYPVETTLKEPLRDEKSWQRDVKEGTTFLGRRGPAALHDLPGFKITEGLAVDPMHQIFLGHVHLLLKRFILSDECHEGKKVKDQLLKAMNDNYCNIRHPKEIQRKPRPYDKAWCASEFKVFLLCCGHKLADILEDLQLYQLALIFGRFTYFIRALLLPTEWMEDVEKKVDLQELICEHLRNVQHLLGREAMNANSHSLTHLTFWRVMFRLYDLSCEPGEAFFGENKRNMDVRNKHYGRQIHLNGMADYLRGHECRRTFQVSRPRNKRNLDNAIFVDRKMRFYR